MAFVLGVVINRGLCSGFIAVEVPGPAAWIAGLPQRAAIGFPT